VKASSAPRGDNAGVGCRPTGGLVELRGLLADRLAHALAVEPHERCGLAVAALDRVVCSDERDVRSLGRVDDLRADLRVRHDHDDAVDALRDDVLDLTDGLVGVGAEVDDLDLDVAGLLGGVLRALRLIDEVLLVALLLQHGDGDLAVLLATIPRGRGIAALAARTCRRGERYARHRCSGEALPASSGNHGSSY
jgi:hypothetical protein